MRIGNGWYLAAALMTLTGALVHAIAGELTTIRSLTESATALNNQVELRAVWHGYTVMLGGTCWLCFQLWRGRLSDAGVATWLATFYILGGLIWIGLVLVMGPQNFIDTPQWALLLIIGGLIALGRRRETAKTA